MIFKPGLRDWLCQTAGAAAPSGGNKLHAVSESEGQYFAAGSAQGEIAPAGGSALHEVKSVGATFNAA